MVDSAAYENLALRIGIFPLGPILEHPAGSNLDENPRYKRDERAIGCG